VYLTTTYLLQELGYEVHVFNVWRNRIKNSFVHTPELQPKTHSSLKAPQVLEAVRRQRFDLVVFNTFEGREVLACARDLLTHTPVLGFMHNGSLVNNVPEYRLMVLAPYIAERFADIAPAGTVIPVHFFDREIPRLPRQDNRRRFCVQGYFDPTRRHYAALLDALKELRREGRSNFEVCIMGRSFDRQFRDFARQVRKAGLGDHVHYTWKGIGYRSYYRVLNNMDFMLPLISPESHPVYFKSKSTSSIAAAVGFKVVPIVHEALARHYSLEGVSFAYTTDLLAAMRRALDISDGDLAALRSRIGTVKQRYLDDSLRQLRESIAIATFRKP
jgi:glycosyltransferase involved in cell wall biosynthesis